VIGRALIDHLTGDPSWDVVALSRRAPDFETTARFLSVDLREKDSATAALAELTETTHVFYAAYQPMPGYTGAINTAMSVLPRILRNAIHHFMRAYKVLTDVDQSARAGYNTRVGAEDKQRGDPNSTVQQP
jgi:hypothetical protein